MPLTDLDAAALCRLLQALDARGGSLHLTPLRSAPWREYLCAVGGMGDEPQTTHYAHSADAALAAAARHYAAVL